MPIKFIRQLSNCFQY